MQLVYFDNSATTIPHKEVIDEVAYSMKHCFGNPSSAHKLGLEAEKKIKTSREIISKLIGASPSEIIFTSGGSESNNTAIKGVVSQGDHIISTKIEHPSVLKLLNGLESAGVEITYLDVDGKGVIDLNQLEASIKDNTRLVSIMHVNNEIGSIQPVESIVSIVRGKTKRVKIHIDAVQSSGRLKIDVKKWDVDMLSLSAHKIHGPKGVGALYIRKGLNINPLVIGGGQEMDIRSGTENVPGIAGFGKAAELISKSLDKNMEIVRAVKSRFIDRLSEIENVSINSPDDTAHIPNILNVSFNGVKGEVLLHALEDYNIYVSTGSACSARHGGHKNYVLPAIGLKESQIQGAIRFSFSYMNTIEEVNYTIDALKKILPMLRRIKK